MCLILGGGLGFSDLIWGIDDRRIPFIQVPSLQQGRDLAILQGELANSASRTTPLREKLREHAVQLSRTGPYLER